MAAVAAGGVVLARAGHGAERTLANFLRVSNAHQFRRSIASDEAAVHSIASSKLSEDSIQHRTGRIYLINQHEPAVHKLPEALRALRAYSLTEVNETVQLSLSCKLKTKKGKNRDPFKGTVIFPHEFGRPRRMLVFAEGPAAEAARRAGASIVGGPELIEKVLAGEVKGFDRCLASQELADNIKPLQRTLKALTPSTRRGTIVDPSKMEEAVGHFKSSKEYKCDRQGNCNVAIGKLDYEDYKINGNLRFIVQRVLEHREDQPKSAFIQKVVLSSAWGPGFLLSVQDVI